MTHHPDKAREAARIAARFFVGTEAADVAIDAFLSKALEGADEKLVEARTRSIQLRQMAKSASEASKFLAADKQARNRAAGDESATYNGLEVSETREWRSAEAIDELLTLVTALSAKLKEVEAEVARPHLCENAEMQSYTGTVEIMPPEAMRRSARRGICVDVCLALEVTRLWSQGIKTTGCCCGHGHQHGYIGVTDECIPAMQALGYQVIVRPEAPERLDSFYPKTKLVNYEQLQSDLTATRNALEEERERCAKACYQVVGKYRALAKDAREKELDLSEDYYAARASAAEDCAEMVLRLPSPQVKP